MRSSSRSWIRPLALVALVPLLAVGCAKSSQSASTNASASGGGLSPINVSVQNFKYSGMPTTVSKGVHAISFTNKETFPITHEMVLISLGGKTTADVINAGKAKGPDSEDQWLHFGEVADVDTGATKVSLFDLPPGTYAIACWQTGTPQGKDNGPTHLTIGMIHQFTVK